MARPQNKTQLLAAMEKEFAALETLIAPLSPEQLALPPRQSGWSVKDILAHLYEWQQMFFAWYAAGLRGETPVTPAPGYKWNQLPALNKAIFEKHRSLEPEQAIALLRQSHQDTLRLIESLPKEQLTGRGLYPWMNQNSLLTYLHANGDAHYIWAVKLITKTLQGYKTHLVTE